MSTFFVPGIPAPQGSKRHLGNGIVVESSKRVKPWRTDIRQTALDHIDTPHYGPIRATLIFLMPRPKSHYRTGRHAGQLRDSAPDWHTSRPDADKLARAVLDALSGVAWADDSQVCALDVRKLYTDTSGNIGVHITVGPDAGLDAEDGAA